MFFYTVENCMWYFAGKNTLKLHIFDAIKIDWFMSYVIIWSIHVFECE